MATDILTAPTIVGTATRTRVYKNFIDGEWVEASTGETFEDRNPADTREVVGIFQKSAEADVDAAVDAAKRAFSKWRLILSPRRAEIVYRAAEMLIDVPQHRVVFDERHHGAVGRGNRIVGENRVAEGTGVAEVVAGAHLPSVFEYRREGGSLEQLPAEEGEAGAKNALPGRKLSFRQYRVAASAPTLVLSYSVDIEKSYFR